MLTPDACLADTWNEYFDSASTDWEIFNFDPAIERWHVANGRVEGQMFDPDFFSIYVLTPQGVDVDSWSEYEVRVRAKLDLAGGANDETRFGLSLYDNGGGNRYLCLLQLQTSQALIIRATPDSWQAIPFPFPVQEDTWYELSASVRTSANDDVETISFRIDGGAAMTITSSATPFGSGGVGLVVSDARVQFDDLEVSGQNIPSASNAPSIRITNPSPDWVFPYGTQSVTLSVEIENHVGRWQQNWWTEFPMAGSAEGDSNFSTSSSAVTFSSGWLNGASYDIFVTLVDGRGNVIPSSLARDSVHFRIADDTEPPTVTHTPVQLALKGHGIWSYRQ